MVSGDSKTRASDKKAATDSGSDNWWLVFLFLLAIMAFNFCWFIAATLASEPTMVRPDKSDRVWSELILPAKKETLSSSAGLSAMEVLFAPVEQIKGRQMSAGCAIIMVLFLILETTALILCLRRGEKTKK